MAMWVKFTTLEDKTRIRTSRLKIICKELGKSEDLITYIGNRMGHDMCYAIESTKVHNELGWLPEIKFEDGIKKTLSYIWKTVNGGKLSSLVSIRIIMSKCTEIGKDDELFIGKKNVSPGRTC